MDKRRWGNVWIVISQDLLADIRERREVEQSGGNYTGRVDDETYRISEQFRGDENLERLFNFVTQASVTYKLFSYSTDITQGLKQDMDYLSDTWGSEVTLGGAWWFNGIQGGMQPPVDPEIDPTPTGTPIYPIPNNLWMFMPDIVVYDENGDEVSRTPATSNADLRDINLMSGQTPRDFTQY